VPIKRRFDCWGAGAGSGRNARGFAQPGYETGLNHLLLALVL
jgi:hypothetical protein